MNISESREKALRDFEDWINATGVLTRGTSYYYEAKNLVLDAFAYGLIAEKS